MIRKIETTTEEKRFRSERMMTVHDITGSLEGPMQKALREGCETINSLAIMVSYSHKKNENPVTL